MTISYYKNYTYKKKDFYSGAQICQTREVIYNIDELQYKTIPGTKYQYNCQLQDVIKSINYDLKLNNYFLHLLICLGGVDEINALTSNISSLFVRDPSFGGPRAHLFGSSFGGRKKRKLHKKRLSRKHRRKSNKKSKRKSKKSKRKLHKKMLTRKRKSKKNTK